MKVTIIDGKAHIEADSLELGILDSALSLYGNRAADEEVEQVVHMQEQVLKAWIKLPISN